MSKTTSISLLIAAAVVVLGFVLNPSAEKHRTRIKEAVAERSPLERALGVGPVLAFVSKYHSLGVASYTVVDNTVTSVGMFGMVFVTD